MFASCCHHSDLTLIASLGGRVVLENLILPETELWFSFSADVV